MESRKVRATAEPTGPSRKSARVTTSTLLVALSLFVLLPASPWNMPYPYQDSGLFLYIGWRLLEGEVPYRDIWDHKPPAVYLWNALGLLLGRGSRWGVWGLELVFLTVALHLAHRTYRKHFGHFSATLALVASAVALALTLDGGNLTEEYALPLQFSALSLVGAGALEGNRKKALLLGFLGGFAFLTKQTTVGVWLGAAIYTSFRAITRRQTWRWRFLLVSALGAVTALIVALLWLWRTNAIMEFWNDAFVYNFFYVRQLTGLKYFASPLIIGIEPLRASGLLLLSLLGLAVLVTARPASLRGDTLALLLTSAIALPLEFMFISSSGRTFRHYYITAVPPLSALAAFLFSRLAEVSGAFSVRRRLAGLLIGCGIVGLALPYYRGVVRELQHAGRFERDVVSAVRAWTKPGDSVLVWGYDLGVNFLTRRTSPTYFVYQYPLYDPNYASEIMVVRFLDELLEERPRLLVDAGNDRTPIFRFPLRSAVVEKKIVQLERLYAPIWRTGSWVVYELRSGAIARSSGRGG